jgi:hypothetical protein
VERKKDNKEDPVVNICVRPTFRDRNYFEIGEPLTCCLTRSLFTDGHKAPKPEPSNFARVHTLRQDLNEQASLAICFSEAALLKRLNLSRPLIARLNYLYQRVVELSWSKTAAQKRCELMKTNTGLNIFIKTNTILAEGPYIHQKADCYFVFSVVLERVKSELEELCAVTSMHALTVLERALTPSNLEEANTFTVISFVALLYQETLLQREAAAILQVDTQSIRHRSLIALDTHLLTWLRLLILKAYKRDCPLIRLLSRDSEMLILREDYWQQWLWESGRLMKLKLMPLPGGVESVNEGEELPALVVDDGWIWGEHTNVDGPSASNQSTANANHNRQPGSTTSRTRANSPATKAAKGPRRIERFKDIALAIRKESKHIVLDYTDLETNARRALAKIGAVIQTSSFGLIKAKRQDGEKALMEQAHFNARGCPFD